MITFENTEIAFAGRTNSDLRRAYWLFRLVRYTWFVKIGKIKIQIANAIGFPLGWIVKPTIFKQFCGGETWVECNKTIDFLAGNKIKTIIDFAAEGKEEEPAFNRVVEQKIAAIQSAKGNRNVPFTVLKMTGISRVALLEKITSGSALTVSENEEWKRVRERLLQICRASSAAGSSLLIDAEETWIQGAIDLLTFEMMQQFNKDNPVVYFTPQLYLRNRIEFLKTEHSKALKGGYILGAKPVRGAYMEQERERARRSGYPSPIHETKKETDSDYDAALQYCIENIDTIYLFAGTHNEKSSSFLADLLEKHKMNRQDHRVFFGQLYGMSDHISFNLSHLGYSVAKHVPFGKVEEVLPYLIRRAEENTSFADHSGRELSLIKKELMRRKSCKK